MGFSFSSSFFSFIRVFSFPNLEHSLLLRSCSNFVWMFINLFPRGQIRVFLNFFFGNPVFSPLFRSLWTQKNFGQIMVPTTRYIHHWSYIPETSYGNYYLLLFYFLIWFFPFFRPLWTQKISVKSWFPQPGAFIIGPILMRLRMDVHQPIPQGLGSSFPEIFFLKSGFFPLFRSLWTQKNFGQIMVPPTWCIHYWSDLAQTSYGCSLTYSLEVIFEFS